MRRSWISVVVVITLCAAVGSAGPTATAATPAFEGTKSKLSAALKARMRGSSWHSGCPVPLRELRLLRMTYWGWDGEVHRGKMIVRDAQADRVLRIFSEIYDARFRIRRMNLVDKYDGSDAASMKHNNTSAFNCRRVPGTARWSQHAYGRAIDINPVQNPFVYGSTVEPEAGREYLDRSDVRKGMIVRPGPVVRAFRDTGWYWGGDWSGSKDYQHFSSTGG